MLNHGLYRIRDGAGIGLLYIGEGRVGERLRAHLGKTRNPDDQQGCYSPRPNASNAHSC